MIGQRSEDLVQQFKGAVISSPPFLFQRFSVVLSSAQGPFLFYLIVVTSSLPVQPLLTRNARVPRWFDRLSSSNIVFVLPSCSLAFGISLSGSAGQSDWLWR